MSSTPEFLRFLPALRTVGVDHAHALRILGVYSDLQAHKAAMPLLLRLAAGCSGQTKVSAVWFSFERLKLQTEREIAAARAAHADMLWYSGYSDQRPPVSVRALIESWSQGDGIAERAIVALFQAPVEPARGAYAAEAVLRDLVCRSRRPLFIHHLRPEVPVDEQAHHPEAPDAARFAL